MKIDRVILSVNNNPTYTVFWNIVSKIWKEKFNIIMKKASFDELNLWPEFDYTPFKKNKIYLNI